MRRDPMPKATRRIRVGVAVVAAAALAATGCITLGPDYERPEVNAPGNYRGAVAGTVAESEASAAEREWTELFADEALRALLSSALADGFDVRIAAARVLQARALYGAAESDRYPALDARGAAAQTRRSGDDGRKATTESYEAALALSWELDFWGRYRRASESARAGMLAAEWGERAVVTSVVAEVATAYYALRALDLELEIARRTIETRQESLRLTTIRESGGAASLADVRQAEQLVLGAEAVRIDAERRIEQQENRLSVLVGRSPGEIARGLSLEEQPTLAALPAGLPSGILERRPDVRQAEELLASATAEIGVAKAAYFPRIALTGAGGVASSELSALFHGPAGFWSAAAAVVAPIFNAGRTRAGVRFAEARRDEAVAVYERTVMDAFREVSDALVGRRRSDELTAVGRKLVEAAADARRLADVRYRGGVASYLEVLDSESRLFEAELGLVRAELASLASYVEVYRALGGGWAPREGGA